MCVTFLLIDFNYSYWEIHILNITGVWTGDYLRQSAIMEIGSKLKERLKFRSQMVYQSHDDAATKSGSNIKKTYTL